MKVTLTPATSPTAESQPATLPQPGENAVKHKSMYAFTEIEIPPSAGTTVDPEPSLRDEIMVMMGHHRQTFFRGEEMDQFFAGCHQLYLDCYAAGWLRHVTRTNRLAVFHLGDIVACQRRLRRDGRPSQTAAEKLQDAKPAGSAKRAGRKKATKSAVPAAECA